MISSAATTATDASAPASSAPANRSDESGMPFDNILALETLAASGTLLEEGTAEEADDTESDEAGEWGPLEFLANLLNIAAVTTPASAGAAASANVDALIPAATDELSQAAAQPASGEADGAAAKLAASSPDASIDAALAALRADEATPAADSQQNATRAVEMLASVARAPAGDAPERAGIATSMRDPRWAEQFGARIALMVRAGESSASLQLSPADLGPLDVSITVRDSQTNIHFGAAHADTRALIEASIPRLREMLAAQGFSLMDASVSQGFARQSRQEAAAASRSDLDSEPEVRSATAITATGLLDLYA